MIFREWWAKHGIRFWGLPVSASRASWNAAIEAAVHKLDERGLASITFIPESRTIRQLIQDLAVEE
jgi:hypothetical protein